MISCDITLWGSVELASIKPITAEDIRRLRRILRLTQKELARRAGVSQSLISRIENRSVDPRLSTVKKIVDILTQTEEKRTAADVMHSPVISVDVRDSVRTAVGLMKRHDISQMPVLRGSKIIGGIREATIIDRIMKSGNPERVFSSAVYNVMEKKFATVNPSTPIDDVVYLLSQGEPAVLVVDDDKLVGIITKIDAISSAINLKRIEE